MIGIVFFIFFAVFFSVIIVSFGAARKVKNDLFPRILNHKHQKNLSSDITNPEKCILRTAKNYGNKITIIDAVRECEVNSVQAEEILNDFAKRGLADMRIMENGAVVYFFHDADSF